MRYLLILLLFFLASCSSGKKTVVNTDVDSHTTIEQTVNETVEHDTLYVHTWTTVHDTITSQHEAELQSRIEEYYDEQGRLQRRITTQSAHIADLNRQIHDYTNLIDSLQRHYRDSIRAATNTVIDTHIDNNTSITAPPSFIDRLGALLSVIAALSILAVIIFAKAKVRKQQSCTKA